MECDDNVVRGKTSVALAALQSSLEKKLLY